MDYAMDVDIIIRSITSFIILFSLSRIMGKKHIANLTFFDYVVGISIGSIAASFAVDESIHYDYGIIALIVYAVCAIVVSKISLLGILPRKIFGGVPTILVQNGEFIERNLKKSKFSVNDLLEECRLNGVFDISEIDYAILETSGKVSILLKPEKKPVTLQDMNIEATKYGIQTELIIDGNILYDNLEQIKKSEEWLIKELKKRRITSVKKVLLASIDNVGNIAIQLKHKKQVVLNVLK